MHRWVRLSVAKLAVGIALAVGITLAAAQTDEEAAPQFPTTEFAEGAKSASISDGSLTAGISLVKGSEIRSSQTELDPELEVPLLRVIVGGTTVLEVPGAQSGFDFPAADASIAEIDTTNSQKEVYFSSYSGGAHCCNTIIVADEVGGKWLAVAVGDFDGDGDYLDDLDGDGVAEIATVDNRFLYQFDSYASSAAPLLVMSVRQGQALDVSTDARFLPAHKNWLKELEEGIAPAERWTSPGFLAGWVAAKVRAGEGADAWQQLNQRWDFAADDGEEICLTGGEVEDCPKKQRATAKFPERLKLFLDQNGYES